MATSVGRFRVHGEGMRFRDASIGATGELREGEDDTQQDPKGRGQFDPDEHEVNKASALGHVRAMNRFQRSSDLVRDRGNARDSARARDQATVDNPKADRMDRFQAASRLRHNSY